MGALALCTCAVAQGGGWAAVRGIPPGSRVEVQLARAKGVKGMLIEASASGMEVQTSDGSTRRLDRRQITKVYLIRRAHKLRDGLIGAGAGSAGGAALGSAKLAKSYDTSFGQVRINRAPEFAAEALVGAAVGAVIGAVIGSRHAKTLVYQRAGPNDGGQSARRNSAPRAGVAHRSAAAFAGARPR
ncbi:MAG: hypothetical protein ACRD13_10240 [Terriglobales bacterium]